MLFQFTGDPKLKGEDPNEITMYGYKFQLNGAPVRVAVTGSESAQEQKRIVTAQAVFKRHSHFTVVTPESLRKKAQELAKLAEEAAAEAAKQAEEAVAKVKEVSDGTDEAGSTGEGAAEAAGARRRRIGQLG